MFSIIFQFVVILVLINMSIAYILTGNKYHHYNKYNCLSSLKMSYQKPIVLTDVIRNVLISSSLLLLDPSSSLAQISILQSSSTSIIITNNDAFEAATKASTERSFKKSLSNNDYQRAKNNEILISQEPRAAKRRAVAACRNNTILTKLKLDISIKECMNKVMSGDIEFMSEALKNIPQEEQMDLVKTYGSVPTL